MARAAHAMSTARHRNQIIAISQPKDLDRNLLNELSGSSPFASTAESSLGVAAGGATRYVPFHDRLDSREHTLIGSQLLSAVL